MSDFDLISAIATSVASLAIDVGIIVFAYILYKRTKHKGFLAFSITLIVQLILNLTVPILFSTFIDAIGYYAVSRASFFTEKIIYSVLLVYSLYLLSKSHSKKAEVPPDRGSN